ncbi:hypothetical protein SGLAM104S_09682 [Streptomyces glaucescens]
MATDTLKSTSGGPAGLRRVLLDNGALTALIVLVVALSALSGDFLTTDNLLNIGVQAAVTAILAFGVTFVIVSAGIDLSVGSVAALSATVLAWSATSEGVPVPLAVLLAVATGIGCGLVNGFLISYGKLPPFIATLAMLSVARGLSLVISQGSPIAFPESVSHLGDTLGGWLPVPVLVMVVMGLLTAFVLGRTYIGRSMYAIGGNEEAARLSGLRVKKQKLAIYALSGLSRGGGRHRAGLPAPSAQPQAAHAYELAPSRRSSSAAPRWRAAPARRSGTPVGALILQAAQRAEPAARSPRSWQQVVIGVVARWRCCWTRCGAAGARDRGGGGAGRRCVASSRPGRAAVVGATWRPWPPARVRLDASTAVLGAAARCRAAAGGGGGVRGSASTRRPSTVPGAHWSPPTRGGRLGASARRSWAGHSPPPAGRGAGTASATGAGRGPSRRRAADSRTAPGRV